jgi:hypothetical protein
LPTITNIPNADEVIGEILLFVQLKTYVPFIISSVHSIDFVVLSHCVLPKRKNSDPSLAYQKLKFHCSLKNHVNKGDVMDITINTNQI